MVSATEDEPKGAAMEQATEQRYVVSVNITVDATDEDEASTFVERTLAGVAEFDVVDVFAEEVGAR